MSPLFYIYFIPVTLVDFIDIVLVSAAIYGVLHIMEGTRARSMLAGLLAIFVVALVAYSFNLSTVAWAVNKLGTVWVIAFIIVFQPELRDLLTRIGNSRIFRAFSEQPAIRIIDDVVSAAKILSEEQIGALFAIQRNVPLDDIARTGKPIDAKMTPELLATIFAPHTPLHDGGVVIVGDKIKAAACEFPMTENPRYRRVLGMRHRAGIGLSEQTDAVVVIVSEETGAISLAVHGFLHRRLDANGLKRLLEIVFTEKERLPQPEQ